VRASRAGGFSSHEDPAAWVAGAIFEFKTGGGDGTLFELWEGDPDRVLELLKAQSPVLAY